VVLTSRVRIADADTRPRMRILVSVLMGQLARPVLSIGDALAISPGASGTLLALVEIRIERCRLCRCAHAPRSASEGVGPKTSWDRGKDQTF